MISASCCKQGGARHQQWPARGRQVPGLPKVVPPLVRLPSKPFQLPISVASPTVHSSLSFPSGGPTCSHVQILPSGYPKQVCALTKCQVTQASSGLAIHAPGLPSTYPWQAWAQSWNMQTKQTLHSRSSVDTTERTTARTINLSSLLSKRRGAATPRAYLSIQRHLHLSHPSTFP